MNAQELIKELGSNLGLELEFSEEHTCALKFGEVTVFFEEYEDKLYLICELGSSVGKEDLFPHLLSENYLGRATANAVLSHDEIKSEFMLHLILQQNITYQQFERILDNFVYTAKKYKNKLTSENMTEIEHEDNLLQAAVLKA
ncbi:type III secretion system chaperone [uncultured Succinivibrio sp.]|uniref:type III secretion system chaperone n=1 Tax=uncultured Succinivibrio sp. TaxID=540749 RepID=UPI0025E904AC|nr:type III secretion system chaperone [uncultured Succinivibrio sp.]